MTNLYEQVEHYRRRFLARSAEVDALRKIEHERNRLAEENEKLKHQNDLLRGAIEQHDDNDGMTRDEVVELQKQERLDMFAAAALSGSIAADGGQNFESEAKMAYSYAEAMEEERAKRLKT